MKYDVRADSLVLQPEEPVIAAMEDLLRSQWQGLLQAQDRWASVTLDLSLVKEIDSRGINLLIDLYRNCSQRDIPFAVRGASAHIKRVFDLFRLESLFTIEEAAGHALD